jgi:hypothetical protein
MVPTLTTSLALARLANSLPNIAAAYIDRSRAVKKNIDTLPALVAAKNGIDVGGIPWPHFPSMKY